MLTPYVYEVTGKFPVWISSIISTTEKYSAFVMSGGKRGK